MAMYLSDSTVVTCMRAGLYQTKKGLLVRRGSLRSRKSMTFAEISSSTVLDRSSVSGPWSWQVWFADVPSRRAGPQVGGAARQLRRDHTGAQRMHARGERNAAGPAALPPVGNQ